MGSDFCICHHAFSKESESNLLSNSQRTSKDILEKHYLTKLKNNDQDTVAEDKENKNHFGDNNSNNNYQIFKKPSNLRDKDKINQNKIKENKVFFSFNQNQNMSSSRKSNQNINGENNKNNSNSNSTSNNNNYIYKKQFTFKEMNLKNSPENIRQNENLKNSVSAFNNDFKKNINDGNIVKKLFNKEEEINTKNKIKEEED